MAATNKDLEKEIEEGRFRSDLYFRLKIVSVHLDPLNQRREDILPLADFFRRQANKKNGRKTKGFSPALRRWMVGYSWKGNVRQLKNVVESLVVMDLDDMLDMDDLSPDLIGDVDKVSSVASGIEPAISFLDDGSSELIGKSMKEIERWATEQTLKLANQNRKETARILGISERNLYRLIQKYGLKQSEEKNSESPSNSSSPDEAEESPIDPS